MPNRIDIFDDVIDRADAERFTLVEAAELALVPGAVAGDSEQQALSFTGWPDWSEFKTLIVFVAFIFFHNSVGTSLPLLRIFKRSGCGPDKKLHYTLFEPNSAQPLLVGAGDSATVLPMYAPIIHI